eukprot:770033-Pyramimonas_sp.AAC.1
MEGLGSERAGGSRASARSQHDRHRESPCENHEWSERGKALARSTSVSVTAALVHRPTTQICDNGR